MLEGDIRLENSRTPTAHAASHGTGGSDAITVAQGQVSGLGAALAAKADLVGGVVPSSQIPAIALVQYLGSVANQSAMLALRGQGGDWCIRADSATEWVIVANDGASLSDWIQLPTGIAPVSSINGQTGAVTLGTGDLAESGGNLFFTAARAIGAALTGFTAAAGTVAATDSILAAFQKVVGNIAQRALSGAIGSSGLTMATARILGRSAAGVGAVEEITVGTGLSLSGGTLTATFTEIVTAAEYAAIASPVAGRLYLIRREYTTPPESLLPTIYASYKNGVTVSYNDSGDAGRFWKQRTSAADNNWNSVTWAPSLNLFCAVSGSGSGNRVMTSPDGVTWTIRTSAADNNWTSVTWAPSLNLFCAVSATGSGNRVMTSPDGVTWTIRTSAADNNWTSVTWAPSLNLFCAVSITGSGNRVMTSPDGVTWTIRTSAADNLWISVTWAPSLNLFCAVSISGSGNGNRVMTSPDGVTWTIRASAADNQWISVTWAPSLNLFCAVSGSGSGNRVMTSTAAP